MKKILILLLFAATGAGAQTVLTTAPKTKTDCGRTGQIDLKNLFRQNSTGEIYYHKTDNGYEKIDFSLPKYDCEPYETFTPWEAKIEGNATKIVHSHAWVYAERDDVNHQFFETSTGWQCPCSCPTTENQARICETCLRHEWRVREYGMRAKEKEKSKYLQIVERVKE